MAGVESSAVRCSVEESPLLDESSLANSGYVRSGREPDGDARIGAEDWSRWLSPLPGADRQPSRLLARSRSTDAPSVVFTKRTTW